jgi:hypothetical protein
MTATQETYKPEYVVYRVRRDSGLNYVARTRWASWSDATKENVGAELVAEGLTEEQAYQFVSLTKET